MVNANSMKILRIIPSSDPSHGGPIESVFRVGTALSELGHTQDVLTFDAPDAPYVARAPMKIIALGSRRRNAERSDRQHPLWSRFGFTPRAVPWIRRHRTDYDAVVISSLWNFAPVAARWALVNGPTPYVVFPHGMLDPWFNRTQPAKAALKQAMWVLNEGPLLNGAYRVLFTSEEERRRAENVFRPYRLRGEVIAYGTADSGLGDPTKEAAAFRMAVPTLKGRKFLLFLSRIHAKKGCEILVNAFADLATDMPCVDLVMAGPDQTGLRAKLQELSAQRGVADRIHWPGMLQGDAKWGAFRAADAFVLPSHQENFGIVVAEALACGRPVLLSDKVNIWREVVKDGAGLVSVDNADGVRNLLYQWLALEPEQRAMMGKSARACFLQRFDVRHAARDLERVLLKAIVEKGRRLA